MNFGSLKTQRWARATVSHNSKHTGCCYDKPKQKIGQRRKQTTKRLRRNTTHVTHIDPKLESTRTKDGYDRQRKAGAVNPIHGSAWLCRRKVCGFSLAIAWIRSPKLQTRIDHRTWMPFTPSNSRIIRVYRALRFQLTIQATLSGLDSVRRPNRCWIYSKDYKIQALITSNTF